MLQSEGAFVDGFDQEPIRFFGPLQSEDLLAFWTLDHKGIDRALADCGDGFFGFGEPGTQFDDLRIGVSWGRGHYPGFHEDGGMGTVASPSREGCVRCGTYHR